LVKPVDASCAYRRLPTGGSCASWRNRATSRTVRLLLPHHSTASQTDRPSSSVIVCSACPARLSAWRTRASRSPERGQHSDCQTFEPAFPVGPFFA
jgi:hypothetical protein